MSVYAVIENETVINMVIWDGNDGWKPSKGYAVECIEENITIGWRYTNGVFTPPTVSPPAREELLSTAENEKQNKINDANNIINYNQWPSKLILGRLSESDKTKFNLWLDYTDELQIVDTSKVPNIIWPTQPKG